MKSRIPITIDPEVHRRARRTARRRETSVSGLIESLLASATGPASSISRVERMLGSATPREPSRGEDPLYDALADKLLEPRP